MTSPAQLDVLRVLMADGLLDGADRRAALTAMVDAGVDDLPFPGAGTLARWRALASVAACDLALVKLYEGHTDALAILAEVGAEFQPPSRSRWGMWAAEAPGARVIFEDEPKPGRRVRLVGAKAWCSGAAAVTHGLMTAWSGDGDGPYLVAVAMDQPQIGLACEAWQAVGMAASASVDVRFDGAVGCLVGDRGAYLDRPGFWQGGCGVAACWHGGAIALGMALRRAIEGSRPDPHKLAELGAVDVALARNAALLREAASQIDAHPLDVALAMALALRVRASAEDTATEVLRHVGRALGAAPFCRDARFARMAADLPVFIRQSHAGRDLAALAEATLASTFNDSKDAAWVL